MSELEDKLNLILSNPEALKQVQSLGEQLGLTGNESRQKPENLQKPQRAESSEIKPSNDILSDDMLSVITKIAPLMKSVRGEDDTTRLLNSLRPFLSGERQSKLDKAEKMIKLMKIMPLLRDNGLFDMR